MAAIKDLSSKTIVITGATSGIGFAALQALAPSGALLIGTGRSEERAAAARQSLLEEYPLARVEFALADLVSQRGVRSLAKSIESILFAQRVKQIDVLVNNAAQIEPWYTATEDGYEVQFAVNHLAPFLLTHLLLPQLLTAEEGRIITVSSKSHRHMRIYWQDVMLRKIYNPLLAYKQSKLANVLFTVELNRRLSGTNVRAFAVDPGLVNTEIGLKNHSSLVRWVWEKRRQHGRTPAQGAATVVQLASCQTAELLPGDYWRDGKPIPPDRYALLSVEGQRLWELSERLCGLVPSSLGRLLPGKI